MKKLILLICVLLAGYKVKAQSYTPIALTGFNADVIADGAGAAMASTNNDVEGVSYAFVSQNFVSPAGQSPARFLPGNGTINSAATPGLTFQLAPYSGNNSLRIRGTGPGTLTFSTPQPADALYVLATSGTGTSNVDIFITFTDLTTQVFTGITVSDWYDGAGYAIQGISRVNRNTNAIDNNSINPRLYQYLLPLNAANKTKLIASIGFSNTGTNNVLNVMGITASTVLPNDIGVTAITSLTSPVPPANPQPIAVMMKNYGSSPLTSATLGFSVDGAIVLNNYVFTPATPLAPNASAAPVTIGNYTFSPGNHILKAWSSLPNGVTDGSKANDTIQMNIVSCLALAGNYTINKNNPVSATNFSSLSAAAQALSSCGVNGPVTFNVAASSGPYIGQVVLSAINGVSAVNTITFNGNGNTVSASPGTADLGVLTLDGTDYVKFDNFTLALAAAATSGWGVQLKNGADNNIISNCIINLPLGATGPSINGIVSGIAVTTAGNSANNLLLRNNIINGGYNGIQLNGLAGTTIGNRIIGNKVRDPFLNGIYIANTNGTIIEDNDISCPTRLNGGNLSGIYLTGTTINTIVSRNRIHNTHDMAIATANISVNGIYTNAAATPGNENIIRNNLVYNPTNAAGIFYALYNQGGNGTYYYYNTVSADNPVVVFSTLRGMYFASAATNVKFINNVISLAGTASTKHAIFLGATTGISLTSNNNDLYVGSTGNIGAVGFSANKVTLADWQAANTSAPYDLNSTATDPLFVNTTSYFQPLASALNNAGQALPTVTDDINGATRSTTTPDPGAYEFTPSVNDAGVTAIYAPTSPVTPGVSQSVQVTLKNFGTAALTSATIDWSVNGTAQADYTWNGNLTSLQSSATPINIGSYTFPAGNIILKVWAKLPNGAADGLAANDTTIIRINSCAPLAGNYTINKNAPVSATNFPSFTDATLRLNSCGVSGPVTITVVSGTGPYFEQVEVLNIPYASATNIITFEGSGNTVTTTPGVRPGIIVLNGAKYVKLNNFVITLDGTATTGWGVQFVNAADFNTISNNIINLPIPSISNTINGIVAGNTTTSTSNGNFASHSRIENNIINGGYYGILLNGNSGGVNASNNQIVGNQVLDPFAYGIYVNNANGTLIEGNDISRPRRGNSTTLYGIQLAGITLNTIVNKNRIHNSNDMSTAISGLMLYGISTSAPATPGNENIIKNNAIYNLTGANSSLYAFYNSGGNGTYYYNNTVVSDPAIAYNTLRGMYFASSSAATNMKFINNIISFPGAATTKHAIFLTTSTPAIALTSNNNDLYVGSTGNIGYFTANKAALADWQAANGNAYDQNSVSADPAFVSASTGNLKPSSATLDNLGQPLAAVTDDILGAVRSATPDFGAYEFGIAANDVGIVTVSGSGLTGCGLSATETITITIRNFGTATQTSIPVSFSVDGITIASETFVGSIAPNDTASYTFTAKANLAISGSHLIIAKTLLAGDLVTTNDSDTLHITNSLVTGLPQTFDFETVVTGISRFRKVTNPKSNITEGTGASFGTGSSKGMIMDGVSNANWNMPVGVIAPWTSNPDNFSAAYMCISPAGGAANDSLLLTFDLKQLFKAANANTNFRVTVNGNAVGGNQGATPANTYRPPFNGTGGTTNWTRIKVDLTTYKNDPFVTIGLESSVSEAYANGTGTANLIDNINILRMAGPTGLKENDLATNLFGFPNPSTGLFNVNLENGRDYELKVTDLTGKTILTQQAKGNVQLKLENQAKGIYLLKVTSAGGTTVHKLIVE
jgi:hypothetical protein